MGQLIDLTGERFVRLLVTERAAVRHGDKNTYWKCKCDCGNIVEVSSYSLRNHLTTSCGCLRAELRHNYAKRKGLLQDADTQSRLYNIWSGLLQRSTPYLDRIHVESTWIGNFKDFEDWAIKNGYNDNKMIKRISPSKGYTPANCAWVDKKDSENNILTYSAQVVDELGKFEGLNISACLQKLAARIHNAQDIQELIKIIGG